MGFLRSGLRVVSMVCHNDCCSVSVFFGLSVVVVQDGDEPGI